MSDNPAVEVAKERRDQEQAGEVMLSTGIRARLIPVAASLLDEVRARVPVPKVPLWRNPDTERDEENPNDPAYTRALEEYEKAKGQAALDAMYVFGVELLDPLPEDGHWLRKLRRLGIEVDTGDPDEMDLAYKKFVAFGSDDLRKLAQRSMLTAAAVERAAASF